MSMKKLTVALLALCTVFLCACGKQPTIADTPAEDRVTLTMWAYPTAATEESLQELLDKFTANHKNITIELTMLGENDQNIVSSAMESGSGPDILLGDLRQLQHARRAGGRCVDLTDHLHKDVYDSVNDAVFDPEGLLFALPVAMDVTTMAINYEMFQAADALQYIDEETRTWTTENFFLAMEALAESDVAHNCVAVYCGGQNGDAGTQALITNLYGGSLLNAEKTRYAANSEPIKNALTALLENEEVFFASDLVGSDERFLFSVEQLPMTLYWTSTAEAPESFTAFPMAYPSPEGESLLPVEIWGLSVYDNGDNSKLSAANTLLSYLSGTAASSRTLARTLGHYPVRYINGFEGDEEVYNELMAMAGAYQQDADGYAMVRTEWYEMLARLADGDNVRTETLIFTVRANKAIQAVQ